jgi:hypothetical protein
MHLLADGQRIAEVELEEWRAVQCVPGSATLHLHVASAAGASFALAP